MLQVWLFFRDGRLAPSPQSAGKHRRALYHNGVIDLQRFVQDQVGRKSEKDGGRTLVTGKFAGLSERAYIDHQYSFRK